MAATKENGADPPPPHAINILTWSPHAGSPVNITATVTGTGAAGPGGEVTFSPLWQNQRPAVDYYNGYVLFSATLRTGEKNNWHGWLFVHDVIYVSKQTALLRRTPNHPVLAAVALGRASPIDTSVTGGTNLFANPVLVVLALPFDRQHQFC